MTPLATQKELDRIDLGIEDLQSRLRNINEAQPKEKTALLYGARTLYHIPREHWTSPLQTVNFLERALQKEKLEKERLLVSHAIVLVRLEETSSRSEPLERGMENLLLEEPPRSPLLQRMEKKQREWAFPLKNLPVGVLSVVAQKLDSATKQGLMRVSKIFHEVVCSSTLAEVELDFEENYDFLLRVLALSPPKGSEVGDIIRQRLSSIRGDFFLKLQDRIKSEKYRAFSPSLDKIVQEIGPLEPGELERVRSQFELKMKYDRTYSHVGVFTGYFATYIESVSAKKMTLGNARDERVLKLIDTLIERFRDGRKAHELSSLLSTDEDKWFVYADLVKVAYVMGYVRKAQEFLPLIADKDLSLFARSRAAYAVSLSGLEQMAINLCQDLPEVLKKDVFRTLSLRRAERGDFNGAYSLLSNIRDGNMYYETASLVVAEEARQGRLHSAVLRIRAFPSPWYQDDAWKECAVATADRGDFDGAEWIQGQMKDQFIRASSLEEVSWRMVEGGEYARACSLAERNPDPFKRAVAIQKVSLQLIASGQIEQGRDFSLLLLETPVHAGNFLQIVAQLASLGHFHEAQEMAERIQDSYQKSKAYSSIAITMSSRGHFREALVVLEKVLDPPKEPPPQIRRLRLRRKRSEVQEGALSYSLREETLYHVLKNMARFGDVNQLLVLLKNLFHVSYISSIFAELVLRKRRERQFQEASTFLKYIKNVEEKSEAVEAFVFEMVREKNFPIAQFVAEMHPDPTLKQKLLDFVKLKI